MGDMPMQHRQIISNRIQWIIIYPAESGCYAINFHAVIASRADRDLGQLNLTAALIEISTVIRWQNLHNLKRDWSTDWDQLYFIEF